MGEAAAHAARAAVRRSLAGYCHPTLARPGRWDDLLHLSADHGGAFATDRVGLCAIRPEHDRLDELRRGRRGARRRRGAEDDLTARRRSSFTAPTRACFAARRGTGSSGCATGRALVDHEILRIRATSSREQMQQQACAKGSPYSITSSARASSVAGISMPSALAVLRLITSWYFEACSTGRSAGFAPLRILSM
jgi:hypothetical protein